MIRTPYLAALSFLFVLVTALPASAQNLTLVRDQEIEDTLRIFSRPIFNQAGLSPQNVRFILLQDDALNAFVTGGQNIFINTGLLLAAKNAEEVFGVIAHETGHISEGHLIRGKQRMEDLTTEALIAQILGAAIAIGTGSPGVFAATGSASSAAALRSLLWHTRTQESSADQAGISFLQGSRLPVSGFLSFMQKLEREELLPESQQSAYMRTHPLTHERVDVLKEAVARQPAGSEAPEEWQELHARTKAKLMGFIFPDRALQDKGTSIASQYARAIATYRKGKTTAALALLAPLIAEEPNNPYFHELKGQILFESGKIRDALPIYQRAVELAPKAGLIRIAYGHALLEDKNPSKQQLDEAIKQLRLSLETAPFQPMTHHLMAMAYGKQGNEGMSRLYLAEEEQLRGRPDFAIIEAKLAQTKLEAHSPGWLRAQDIINLAEQTLAERQEKH